MSEEEKMLKGEIYNANYDNSLLEKRTKAKKLCYEYNFLKPDEFSKRHEILEKLTGKKIDIMAIEPTFFCDYGYNITFGKNFYSNHNLVILDANKVTFGENVFVGPNCGFYTSSHPIDYISRNEGLEYAKPISIGSNVWIGGNVCVLPGVTVGDNVVIGAGSVVVKDIESNSVACGNPCKVIRKIGKRI